MESVIPQNENHLVSDSLNDEWTLWAHLPHDSDWSLASYKKIMDFNTIEKVIVLTETIPHNMIRNCMIFLMRKGINPMWEDVKNKDGGSFSYKVSNKHIHETWKDLTYKLVGETMVTKQSIQSVINGITISPKKNFCVIKIWMANSDNQDSATIGEVVQGIGSQGCLFKKHNPAY